MTRRLLALAIVLAVAGCLAAPAPGEGPAERNDSLAGGSGTGGAAPPAGPGDGDPDGDVHGAARALFLLVETRAVAEGGRLGAHVGAHCRNVTYSAGPEPSVDLVQMTPRIPVGVLVRDWNVSELRASGFGTIDDGGLVVAFDPANGTIPLAATGDPERTLANVTIRDGSVHVDGLVLPPNGTRVLEAEYAAENHEGARVTVRETLTIRHLGDAAVTAREPRGYCD